MNWGQSSLSSEYLAAQQRLFFEFVIHLNMKTKVSTVALAAVLFVGLSLTSSFAQVGISIGIAPPPIPIYQQPYAPGAGYIWTPGYWAYDSGYYWVPGAWILPPRIGFLWTPGYWAYNGSNYFFNNGYWGPTVGFYGGVNYGYGYGGHGYYGGRWVGNSFRYNRAVTRVNTSVIHNTYVNRQVVNKTVSRASLTARAAQQPGLPPRNKRQRRRSTSQLLPPSSHVLKPRKTIQICTLLIITASLKPKRSRHSTATAKRRPMLERRKAAPARKLGTPHSATSRATRRPAQQARKTTPTARHNQLTHMLRT